MACIRLAPATLSIGFALLLGAAPQEARAGACKEAGLRSACVKSKDIAPGSLRALDVSNESQGYFTLGSDAFNIPDALKNYAQVPLTPSSDGWLIITASANIGAGIATNNINAKGDVACFFKFGRRSSTAKIISSSQFTGSVSRKFQPFVSIVSSTRQKVEGGKSRTVFLACRRDKGIDLSISKPALTVVFHPIQY